MPENSEDLGPAMLRTSILSRTIHSNAEWAEMRFSGLQSSTGFPSRRASSMARAAPGEVAGVTSGEMWVEMSGEMRVEMSGEMWVEMSPEVADVIAG